MKLILLGLLSISAMAQPYLKLGAMIFSKDNQKFIALEMKHESGWHTYWKNPGDAGVASQFALSLKDTPIQALELEWPAPKRYIEQGDMLAFGYSQSPVFFFKIPKLEYERSLGETILIQSKFLICKDICIPGEANVSISLNEKLPISNQYSFTLKETLKKLSNIPKRSPAPGQLDLQLFKAEGKNLALHYTLTNVDANSFDTDSNLLTPFPKELLDFKRENIFFDKKSNTLFGRLEIAWDGEYEDPPILLPIDGKFQNDIELKFLLQKNGRDNSQVITKSFRTFNLEGDQIFKGFLNRADSDRATPTQKSSSLFYYILLAFLGGIILNIMPCVLPVISLKLFGLIAHKEKAKKTILKHNLFYSLGVWVTFMLLAIVIVLLKVSGEKIGWGFQLQSPPFVYAMLIVLFVMTLNMFGLFEFQTPGGKALGSIELNQGYASDFINGVLATILSTPCSAPFLGVALSFAFTTSTYNIFIVFTAIAAGLSMPFLLTGFFPGLVNFLPRPGAWMIKLKYFLGLSLLMTFIWLYDVLFSLIDSSYAMVFHASFAFVFFAFFFRAHINKKFIYNSLIFAIPLSFIVYIYTSTHLEVSSKSFTQKQSQLNWRSWSPEAMAAVTSQDLFIDFTASWCLTCKVNKKLVLETDAFAKLVQDYDLSLQIGDWTKRDESITDFLKQNNLVGIPAYFIKKKSGELIFLGETISIDEIKSHL